MLARYLELIKFSHTVFALPFALVATLIAMQGTPGFSQVFWIIIAMTGARSGAMGFNRLVDRKYDQDNPRTANRPSVTGEISPSAMIGFVMISYGVFVFATWMLNELTLYLSPLVIVLTAGYSYAKRFTPYTHLILGLAIGIAPIAAWIAVTGSISMTAICLGLATFCWIAGFDILYALQDYEFDTKENLYSIPSKFGIQKSILISRGLHIVTVVLWLILYFLIEIHFLFFVGILICTGLLLKEHLLIKADDLSKMNIAFFNMNGYISMTMLSFTALSYLVMSIF